MALVSLKPVQQLRSAAIEDLSLSSSLRSRVFSVSLLDLEPAEHVGQRYAGREQFTCQD